VETTGKKTRRKENNHGDPDADRVSQVPYEHPDGMGAGNGFGTSEFHNPNSQTPDVSSGHK
jgi:hypothetical protein